QANATQLMERIDRIMFFPCPNGLIRLRPARFLSDAARRRAAMRSACRAHERPEVPVARARSAALGRSPVARDATPLLGPPPRRRCAVVGGYSEGTGGG